MVKKVFQIIMPRKGNLSSIMDAVREKCTPNIGEPDALISRAELARLESLEKKVLSQNINVGIRYSILREKVCRSSFTTQLPNTYQIPRPVKCELREHLNKKAKKASQVAMNNLAYDFCQQIIPPDQIEEMLKLSQDKSHVDVMFRYHNSMGVPLPKLYRRKTQIAEFRNEDDGYWSSVRYTAVMRSSLLEPDGLVTIHTGREPSYIKSLLSTCSVLSELLEKLDFIKPDHTQYMIGEQTVDMEHTVS